MSAILLNAIESHITHEVNYNSSKILNEFENGISKAMHIAIPEIFKQITKQPLDSDLLSEIYDLVSKISVHSDEVLNNLSEILVENESVKNIGISLLDTIFDKNSNVISSNISDQSFIKIESANQILIMSAVLILAYIAKKQISKSEILMADKNMIPEVIEKKQISLDNYATIESHEFLKVENQNVTVQKPSNVTQKPVENTKLNKFESKSFLKKNGILLIILLILIVFAISFFFVESSKEKIIIENTKLEIVNTKVESQPQIIKPADVTKLGDFINFTLPSDAILHIPEKGFEKSVLDMILNNSNSLDESNWWLEFDTIYFEARETKFKIDSEAQIKNLAQILNSFPKVKIKIGCYTDNLGDKQSNLMLSEARAQSLRSALIELGVQPNRLIAEGFGEEFSISSNDTEAGRAENRRIAIKIIEK